MDGADTQGGSGNLADLPLEVWETIAQSGMTVEDVQRLAAVGPSLAWLGPRVDKLRQRRALASTADACRDYIGCAHAFLDAVADDDADTAMALTRSGHIPLDEPEFVPALFSDRGVRQALIGVESDEAVGGTLTNYDVMIATLPFDFVATTHPAGYPYMTPLSLAAAAGAGRTVARMIRDGASAWPSPESVLAYALRMPLASQVRSETDPAYDASEAPTVVGPWRRLDTARLVRRIAAAYPPLIQLDPWDRHPLHVLATNAADTVPSSYRGDTGDWPRRVVEIAASLVDAGYSPDQLALGDALTMWRGPYDRRTVRQRTKDDLITARNDQRANDVAVLQALDDFYEAI